MSNVGHATGWWASLDNFVSLNSDGDVPESREGREYLRGGFEILRDSCPFGEDTYDRATIVAALVYAHSRWNGPTLDALDVW